MIRYWKKCKRCHRFYDMGINEDFCPECRIEKIKIEVRDEQQKII